MSLLCLLFVLVQDKTEEQPAVEPAAPAVGRNPSETLLIESASSELRIQCRVAGLDDARRQRLEEEMAPVVKAAAARMSTKETRFQRYSQLPLPLRLKIVELVCGATDDKDVSIKVRLDVGKREALHARLAKEGFVGLIDHAAWLSSEQLVKARQLSQKLQESSKLPSCFQLIRSGVESEEINKEIVKFLTAEQLEDWKKVRKGLGQQAVVVGDSDMSRDEREDQLRADYRRLGERYLNWYQSELDLQPKQFKRLQLALKGLISRTVPEELARQDNEGAGAAQPGPGALAYESVLSQAFASARWTKFVDSALTDAQKEKLREINTQRSDRFVSLMSGYVIAAIACGHKTGAEPALFLDAEQLVATQQIMARSMSPLRTLDGALPGQFVRLTTIADADYEKAMGVRNWELFKPVIEGLRSRAEAKPE